MSPNLHTIIALAALCLAHGCLGASYRYVAHEDADEDQVNMAHLLNDDLVSNSNSVVDYYDDSEDVADEDRKSRLEYLSNQLNTGIDDVMADFENNDRVKKTEGDATSTRSGHALVSMLQHHIVNQALSSVLTEQCEATPWHARRTLAKKFDTTLEESSECLQKLQNNMAEVATSGKRSRQTTVREQVMAQVTCNVVPEIVSCFAPVLEGLGDCTSSRHSVKALIFEINILLDKSCRNQGGALIEHIRAAPRHCVSTGVELFFKYLGPSFLGNVEHRFNQDLPCEYMRYISSVVEVVMQNFCGATDLIREVKIMESKFSKSFGCGYTVTI